MKKMAAMWLVLSLAWSMTLPMALSMGTAADGTEVAADSALFWQIERDGRTVGYLLGTIHSEDPRVLDFSEAFLETMQANDVFAMEMVPDLPTLTRMMDYMQYQDGTRLETVVGEQRYVAIARALTSYRMPVSQIEHLKLWAAVLTLSVPPPRSGLFMDFSLSLRASGGGMRVVGLETLEEQLSFLESMPVEQQLAMLDDALDSYGQMEDIHRQMVEAYLRNDIGLLLEQSSGEMDGLDPAIIDYFETEGIVNRNLRMAARLREHLAESTVFTAVGALHLPGEKGLIELLRSAGYRLKALPPPFYLEENSGYSSKMAASPSDT